MSKSLLSLKTFFQFFLLVGILALDQATKYWSRIRFSLPNGEPDYFQSLPIIGHWIEFRLVYNTGAAFGLKPQNFIPFLNPTLFYVIFSLVAIVFLSIYYFKLLADELAPQLGIVMILSGAFGNLIDRIQLQKVTDFIDVGIPGFAYRWPTFNIADSAVCIGMVCLLLAPLWYSRKSNTALPIGENPSSSQASIRAGE